MENFQQKNDKSRNRDFKIYMDANSVIKKQYVGYTSGIKID